MDGWFSSLPDARMVRGVCLWYDVFLKDDRAGGEAEVCGGCVFEVQGSWCTTAAWGPLSLQREEAPTASHFEYSSITLLVMKVWQLVKKLVWFLGPPVRQDHCRSGQMPACFALLYVGGVCCVHSVWYRV
jgi:hypothetical protein